MRSGFTPIIILAIVAILLTVGGGIYLVSRGVLPTKSPAPPAAGLPSEPILPPLTKEGCIVTGCSSEVCAGEPIVTTCIFKAEYACYRTARCEQQANGRCGWTETEALKACLARERADAVIPPPKVCPGVHAPECIPDTKTPTCQETLKKLEQQYPGCFTNLIIPAPQPPPPQPPLPPQAATELMIEADDRGFYPSGEIRVAESTRVKLTFIVRTTNVYFGGLDFRSPKFNTPAVPPGSSTTVEFVADEKFSFSSYWPSSGVLKATGQIIIE